MSVSRGIDPEKEKKKKISLILPDENSISSQYEASILADCISAHRDDSIRESAEG